MKKPILNDFFRIHSRRRERGFALVVTLTLLILLTVIAVGLLSLSTISLRSSSSSSDMATARSNARMALFIALGQLQKTAGPDTRVTARADLLDDSNPAALGVWRSWEGTDHENSGRPIAPNYSKNSKFLAWLTSDDDSTNINAVPDTGAGTDKVTLLGENTVGTTDANKRQVHLKPVPVSMGTLRGSYAWWVDGENQKVRLPRPYAPGTDNAAFWSAHAKSHSTADTKPFGLETLLSDGSLKQPAMTAPADRAVTIKGGDLLNASGTSGSSLSKEYYHDLSTTSVGLLTNTATGGWRKDLTLAADNWATINDSNLPMFRLDPTKDLMYTRPKANGNDMPQVSLLYPWSDYRRGATDLRPIYSFPPIGSWANLMDYASLYKKFNPVSASSAMSTPGNASSINSSSVFNYIHTVRMIPNVARIQWVYRHKTIRQQDGKYNLYLVMQPLITLWNPYNVRLTGLGAFTFRINGPLPPLIAYTVDGVNPVVEGGVAKSVANQASWLTPKPNVKPAIGGLMSYQIANVTDMLPGETRVFSCQSNTVDLGQTALLEPGWFPNGGPKALIASGITPGAQGGQIKTAITYNTEMDDVARGVGMAMDMDWAGAGGAVLAYRMLYSTAAAAKFYPIPAPDDFPTPTLAAAEVAKGVDFLVVTFGARMASHTLLPSKGFVQSSPFVNYTAMGDKALIESTIRYAYPGVHHNVNSPFEYSFNGTDSGFNATPQASGSSGFIMTGFTAANGLKKCVVSELPGRPLASLGELQSWDARYENPIPPYSFNLVGNSEATPLIPSNAVVNSAAASQGRVNLQHDDSYCLNHVLFDDWFCSSIAAEPSAFGRPSLATSSRQAYQNFLSSKDKPLANRAYKPVLKDTLDPANAALENMQDVQTSWKTMASNLEVEGMFNVNSTSVNAWRALLGHARNQRVPYMSSSGSPTLSAEVDHAISRFAVAADTDTSRPGSSGTFANATEYVGYRLYSESQLDFLAKEIVDQVRLRGPFLSLSEFVNRQLSNGDLALAGAIQTALNKLAASSQSPFGILQAESAEGFSTVSTEIPPGADGTSPSGYSFPAAARGFRTYGLPGWTRQADILRPLAPILSARDDTFTIRAYGDSRDSTGNQIKASAVCEATVRRKRDFVDQDDHASLSTLGGTGGSVPSLKPVNQTFGRKFELVSFRWLAADEI